MSALTAAVRRRAWSERAHSSMIRAIADGRSVDASTAAVAAALVRTRGRPSLASSASHPTRAGRAAGWPVHTSGRTTMAARSSLKRAFT
ncbi:hypothetical protein [Streptomyces lavendulae]|uniref:hypothetical protein n=1 Tax=Streptomyces lavendulae TaxID=1914 RepID=UPI002557B126|nr:hypothetical protein [Streptomyces lavendulae]